MNKINLPISDKATIRAEVKQRIARLSEEEKNSAALSLCKKLLCSPQIQKAQNIIGYRALSDEVSTAPFFEEAQKLGKHIFIINLQGNTPSLPDKGVILIPGRAFTLSGKRIGRGGGWYDKFLSQYPYLYTIGVCFECQIFPELPQDNWDISMNEIITGKGI